MKIANTSTKELKEIIVDAAVKAYKISGYNVPPARDLAEIVTFTADNFRKYFKNNDTADIATAFEHGALGDYGENSGISVARFHQWMRHFNGNGTNNQQPDEEPPAKPLTPRDHIADAHNMVNSAYQLWLQRGYNLIPAEIILKWLVSDNKIPELRKKSEMARAKAEENLASDFARFRKPFQKIADFIKANQATEADAVLLDLFFEECKNAGKENIY